MKCTRCQKNESVYTENCLVVEHSSERSPLSGMQIREQLSGVKTVGLCKKCQLRAAFEQAKRTPVSNIFIVVGVIAFFALCYFIIGAYNKSEKSDPSADLILTIGLSVSIAALAGCLIGAFVITPIYLIKKQPGILLPYASSDKERYVPFKKEYYKDSRAFKSLNRIGINNISDKIYRLIETDEIVSLLLTAALTQEAGETSDLSDDGSTLNRCVNRLLELYRKKPEGYLTSQAGEVRAVGEDLDKEGGFDLMLQAHKLFAQKNPAMARNLEMVWDGIGGWRG